MPDVSSAQVGVLRVALNVHLSGVLAHSSVGLDPATLGDAAVVMITGPTRVVYEDRRNPHLDVELGTGRFVAIDQAAGWVYGLTMTPQYQATSIEAAVAAARAVERAFGATAWQRDSSAPWHAGDDTLRTWLAGEDETLPVARYTSGSAEVRVSLERTGAPSPSERIRGKTSEAFFVNIRITDMARLDAYEARVLRERRAHGDGSRPLRLSAFMRDTSAP